jgi:ribosomal protein S18 acetylase RimI-like enzyme
MGVPSPGSQGLTGGYQIVNLASVNPKERQHIIERVIKIERKVFPSSEAFDFGTELKKKNTTMLLATKKDGETTTVTGYLVYLRMKKVVLLHKVCVIEQMRGQGIGKSLVHSLLRHLEKGGCHSIQLWVDEARMPARALYQSFGFQQSDYCLDYYGPGRNGLKMQLSLEK